MKRNRKVPPRLYIRLHEHEQVYNISEAEHVLSEVEFHRGTCWYIPSTKIFFWFPGVVTCVGRTVRVCFSLPAGGPRWRAHGHVHIICSFSRYSSDFYCIPHGMPLDFHQFLFAYLYDKWVHHPEVDGGKYWMTLVVTCSFCEISDTRHHTMPGCTHDTYYNYYRIYVLGGFGANVPSKKKLK